MFTLSVLAHRMRLHASRIMPKSNPNDLLLSQSFQKNACEYRVAYILMLAFMFTKCFNIQPLHVTNVCFKRAFRETQKETSINCDVIEGHQINAIKKLNNSENDDRTAI